MITHTMIVSFDQPLPDGELDQYLADIESVVLDSGVAESVRSRRHIPVAGEEEIPAMIATAIVQIVVADLRALEEAFETPGLEEVIGRWQARYPYRVAWANHEPMG